MEAAMRASKMSENTPNAIRTLTHSVKTEAIVPGLANPHRQFTLLIDVGISGLSAQAAELECVSSSLTLLVDRGRSRRSSARYRLPSCVQRNRHQNQPRTSHRFRN